MEDETNIAELLRDCPIGTELWSDVFGWVKLEYVDMCTRYPIALISKDDNWATYLPNGHFDTGANVPCSLWPSPYHRDWSDFKVTKPKKHKEFKPFEKVLVKLCGSEGYMPAFYGRWDETLEKHSLICSTLGSYFNDSDVIPYEGNENLIKGGK